MTKLWENALKKVSFNVSEVVQRVKSCCGWCVCRCCLRNGEKEEPEERESDGGNHRIESIAGGGVVPRREDIST